LDGCPALVVPFLAGVPVFDSSCSPEAQVWFADRDGGCFVKRAASGTLATEAAMTRYFHAKSMAGQVLAYTTAEDDWLVTARVPGADAASAQYLDQPRRLCDTLAETLLTLHSTDHSGCPVPDRTATYLATAETNSAHGEHDTSYAQYCGYSTIAQAHDDLVRDGHLLRTDTLLHGDYCLPNIIMDGWSVTGFCDLGNGGVGDRHVDVYWALWTLRFNLGTDEYRPRFLDAYGRDHLDDHLLRLCAAAEAM